MADDGRNDTEPEAGPTEEPLETELERTRKLILERRNRFMAAALAGIGMAGGQACTRASVCLSFPAQAGSSGAGQTGGGNGGTGGSMPDGPCPGQPSKRQPPCVCLSLPMSGTVAPPLGGTTAPPIAGSGGTAGTAGAGGTAGTRPNVCLSPPIDEDAGTEFEP